MIIAWTAFIIGAIVTLFFLVAWAVMAYGLFAERDGTCAGPFIGCAFLTFLAAILTSMVAQYIWGGGV